MARQVLDVLERDPLAQQVGNAGDAERMPRQLRRKPHIAHPSFDHPVNVIGRQAVRVSRFSFRMAVRERGLSFGASRKPTASIYSLQIVPDWNLSRLSPLFMKS